MKTYQCHKQVHAAKIVNIVRRDDGASILHLEGGSFLAKCDKFMAKHEPHCGGYLVAYSDGYESFSPAEAFEAGYTALEAVDPKSSGMTFGEAIGVLKRGGRVARSGWNGKGMFVYLVPANAYPAQTPAAKGFFGDGALVPYNAYFALKGVDNVVSTWVPSVTDALADDWALAGYEQPAELAA